MVEFLAIMAAAFSVFAVIAGAVANPVAIIFCIACTLIFAGFAMFAKAKEVKEEIESLA